MTIEKTVELTQKDIFGLRVVSFKETRLHIVFIAVFCFVLTNIILHFLGRADSFLFILSVVLLVFLPLYYGLLYYMSGKIKKETVVFNHPMTYTIKEDEFHVEGYKTSSSVSWEDFFTYMEDKNGFYLFISSVQAYLLPKRYFEKSEIENIGSIIHTKVTKKSNKIFRTISYIISIIFLLSTIVNLVTISRML